MRKALLDYWERLFSISSLNQQEFILPNGGYRGLIGQRYNPYKKTYDDNVTLKNLIFVSFCLDVKTLESSSSFLYKIDQPG